MNRVYFNFEDGPNGTIAFGSTYEGGFDKERPLHRFCLNLMKYLESEACSRSFEVVNGEEVLPSTTPPGAL